MRVFILGIALIVLACGQGPTQPSLHSALGEQVNLLTQQHAPTEGPGTVNGCHPYYQNALLVVDKTYGTAMADKQAPSYPSGTPPQPVLWPFGYTGFRVGSEVAVVDGSGTVVAITGNRYSINMGTIASNEPQPPGNPFPACGRPSPESEWWTPPPGG
jgi:hypothetical protein